MTEKEFWDSEYKAAWEFWMAKEWSHIPSILLPTMIAGMCAKFADAALEARRNSFESLSLLG